MMMVQIMKTVMRVLRTDELEDEVEEEVTITEVEKTGTRTERDYQLQLRDKDDLSHLQQQLLNQRLSKAQRMMEDVDLTVATCSMRLITGKKTASVHTRGWWWISTDIAGRVINHQLSIINHQSIM